MICLLLNYTLRQSLIIPLAPLSSAPGIDLTHENELGFGLDFGLGFGLPEVVSSFSSLGDPSSAPLTQSFTLSFAQ
jgi:small-conductance mechanosensitive channel